MSDPRLATITLFHSFLYELVRLSTACRSSVSSRSEAELYILNALAGEITAQLPRLEMIYNILREARPDDAASWEVLLSSCLVHLQNIYQDAVRIHSELGAVPAASPRIELKYFLHDVWAALTNDPEASLSAINRSGTPRSVMWPTPVEQRHLWMEQPPVTPTGRVVAIRFPRLDGAAPLFWPLLAHELAHRYLYLYGSSIGFLVSRDRIGLSRRKEELLCDLIATRLFGPCYVAALAVGGVLGPSHPKPNIRTDTHPAYLLRLSALFRFLGYSERGPTDPSLKWVEGFAGPLVHLGNEYEFPFATPGSLDQALWECIDELSKLAADFPIADLPTQEFPASLCDALKDGVPIGCARALKPESVRHKVLDWLGEVDDSETRGERLPKPEFLSVLNGTPVPLRTITEIGWRVAGELFADFLPGSEECDIMSYARRFAEHTRGIDERLLMSLDHRALVSRFRHHELSESKARAPVARPPVDKEQSVPGTADVQCGPAAQCDDAKGSSGIRVGGAGCGVVGTRTPPASVGALSERDFLERLTRAVGDRPIVIEPIMDADHQIQPASIDLHLGSQFIVFRRDKLTHLDFQVGRPGADKWIIDQYSPVSSLLVGERFVLHPGEFVLGTTLEYIVVPDDLVAILEGRSSWGRLGIEVHSTAGFVDPGFPGHLTFELKNVGKLPMELFPGLRIAQLFFIPCRRTSIPYVEKSGQKYSRVYGVMTSKFFNDAEWRAFRGDGPIGGDLPDWDHWL